MILWLSDLASKPLSQVGGKAFNLAKLIQAGIPVPKGFVIPASVYSAHVNQHGLQEKIDNILASASSPGQQASEIHGLFSGKPLSPDLKQALVDAFKSITSGRVAVRSSATAEDLPGLSFAGQYTTFLNVTEGELEDKVITCWQSLWNERAIAYRKKNEITGHLAHGVVVQEMINSAVSGVAFTANPINGVRHEMVINSAFGLGEAIVSGEVNPDQLVVNRVSGSILEERIAMKAMAYAYGETGIVSRTLSEEEGKQPALTRDQVNLLVAMGNQIEDHFKSPQDIEFAFDQEGVLHIVQSRPITTLFPIDQLDQDGKLRAYLSASTVLLGQKEPFTPLGFNVFSGMFPAIISIMTNRKKPLEASFVKYQAGRIFVDMTYLLSWNFMAKQFGKTFAGNDLPLEAVMNDMVARHGYTFSHQGIRFKIPWGVFSYGFKAIPLVMQANKLSGSEKYATVRQLGEAYLERMKARVPQLKTLEDKLDFCFEALVEAFKLTQVQGFYCIDMQNQPKIEKAVRKLHGDRFDIGILSQAFPDCITVEMAMEMNRIAGELVETGQEPTMDHPRIQAFMETYGHRANAELDFGHPRWREEPGFILDQIASFMKDDMYKRNLADMAGKAQQADLLTEEIFQATLQVKGKRAAQRLKDQIINFRLAAGMREYPKYNIVQGLDLARSVMLDYADQLVEEGKLNQAQDLFFLTKDQLLAGGDLKALVAENRATYDLEMGRKRIPRLLLNSGEALYSANVIQPGTKVFSGIPLSPGVMEGRIRVVNDPTDTSLEEGEILVTESTNPTWTPLFMVAGGLIMEYGGPVSHGGIVAREYGIPAVVGIPSVMDVLKTGQWVRINGETGLVEVLEDE